MAEADRLNNSIVVAAVGVILWLPARETAVAPVPVEADVEVPELAFDV